MRIYLRPIQLEDGHNIVKWRNDKNVKAHCFNKTEVTIESNEKFYYANVVTGKYKQFIVERIDEEFGMFSYPIATVYLKDMDSINHRCELCIFTSDDQEWNTESQSIAIKKLLEMAFFEFKMHKVYTYVFKDNDDEVELMECSGFKKEAVLKEEGLDIFGNYVDVIRMYVMSYDLKF